MNQGSKCMGGWPVGFDEIKVLMTFVRLDWVWSAIGKNRSAVVVIVVSCTLESQQDSKTNVVEIMISFFKLHHMLMVI